MTMLSRRVIRLADEVHGVLEEARKLKINLSAVLTEALLEKFRENKRERRGYRRIKSQLNPLTIGLTRTVRSAIFNDRSDGPILHLYVLAFDD